MRSALAVVALLALFTVLAPVAPAAAEAPNGRLELGIAVGQTLAGATAAVGAGYLAVRMTEAIESPFPALLAIAFAPAAIGGTICWLGGLSPSYDQRCSATVVGAYLGALSMIPLALIGASGETDSEASINGGVGAAVIGWVVVQPLLATIAWHTAKRRRASPAVVARAPLLAAPERRRALRAPGEVSWPILSLGF